MLEYVTIIITGVVPVLSCVLSALLSSKLTNYKIDELQKNVAKLGDLVIKTAIFEEQIKVVNHRIDDMETVLKNAKKN